MRARTALIIGLAAIMTPLILKDLSGSEPPKGANLVFGIEDNRARIQRACVERLRRIAQTRSALTEDELLAIRVLGSHRSAALPELESLLRVVHMRRKKSNFPESHRSTMAWRPLRMELLSDYPAARALISIGLPSVRAIIEELNVSERPLPKDRLKIYSGILVEILGAKQARPFIQIEREAIPEGRQKFDALLRFIDEARAEWRSRKPKFEIRMPSGKAAPQQDIKPAEAPATKPARR